MQTTYYENSSSTGNASDPAGVCSLFAEGAGSGRKAKARPTWLKRASFVSAVLAVLLLTLVADTFPRSPLGTDADSSWAAVLEHAARNGLQYGKDIVFTYGPLGYLATSRVIPSEITASTAAELALSLAASAGVCLLAWRMALLWRVLMLAVFALVVANGHFGSNEILINVTLVAWGLLCFLESGPRLVFSVCVLALLAALFALVKFTCLVAGSLTVGAVVGDLILRKQYVKGGLATVLFVGGGLAAWGLLGQGIGNLDDFLRNGSAIAGGYTAAMGLEGLLPWRCVVGSLFTAGAALITIGVRIAVLDCPGGANSRWRRALIWSWLSALLFLLWKHGLVRADGYHLQIFIFCVVVLLFGLEALPSRSAFGREWARALTVMGACIAAWTIQTAFFPGYLAYMGRHTLRMPGQRLEMLARPEPYWTRLREQQRQVNHHISLPRLRALTGEAAVDLFGHRQSYLLFNGFNYQPRPVFQSYTVYTSELARLNEDFFLSERAPAFVLFRLEPMQGRLPALEDSAALRHLLINYEPVEAEGPCLLLQKKPGRPAPARLTLLRAGTVGAGEPISIPGPGPAPYWLEIDVKPSLMGHVRQWVYRPPDLRIKLWSENAPDNGKVFLAPAPMLAAGFLASPFLEGTSDVVDLYAGQEGGAVTAYSIEPGDSNERYWATRFGYRLYKIENPVGRSSPPAAVRFKYPGFGLEPDTVVTPATEIVSRNGVRHLVRNGVVFDPLDVVSKTNVLLQLENQAALVVRPGGFAKFTVPAGARKFTGGYGFIHSASQGTGVEFAVEEVLPDGSIKLLHSRRLNPAGEPEDKGLHRFEVPLSGDHPHNLYLRTRSPVAARESSDLTGWACIRYE